jgi:hypothetical protein
MSASSQKKVNQKAQKSVAAVALAHEESDDRESQ